MARRIRKQCPSCQQLFLARRDAKTCSERCRKRMQRAKSYLVEDLEAVKDAAEKVLVRVESKIEPSYATQGGFVEVASAQTPQSSPPQVINPGAVSPVVEESLESVNQQIQPTSEANQTPWGQVVQTGPQTPIDPRDSEEYKPGRFARYNSRRGLTVATILVFLLVSGGIFGLNQYKKSSGNSGRQPAFNLSSNQINNNVTVGGQGQLTINYDTTATKNLTVLGLLGVGKPPVSGGAKVQVTGDVSASGTLYAGGGVSSLSNSSLVINNTQVCTAAGCKIAPGSQPASGVALQSTSPGNAQTGNINITGTVVAGQFNGDGSLLGNLDASNISSGTISNARLSGNVTLAGNSFNGASQLVQLSAASELPAVSGALLTSLNASNITLGTLNDSRLSTNVVLQNSANTFTALNNFTGGLQRNGFDVCDTSGNCAGVAGIGGSGTAGNLPVFTTGTTIGDSLLSQSGGTVTTSGNFNVTGQYQVGGSQISSANLSNDSNLAKLNANQTFTGNNTFSSASNSFTGNGSGLTSLNASNISSGTLNDLRLSSNVTLQGNTFNGANQLLQLNASGDLPALSGINLTNLNASQLTSGTVNDARLSNNVTVQGNTFNGANQLIQATALSFYPALNGSLITNLNASNLASGTVNDARLSANVALLNANQTFSGNNTFSNAISAIALQASGASLSVGTSNKQLLLAGDTTSTLKVTDSGNDVTIGFAGTPSGNVSYNFDASATPGTYTICSSIGNCASAGGGVTTAGGTTNKLSKFTGSQSIGNSNISDNGTKVTVQPGSNSTNTFEIQNTAGSSNLFIADTTNTRIGIGKAPTLGTLDVNGSIYQAGNQVCDTSGNCAGVGGQIGGSGTIGTIPIFTGTGTIGDSNLTKSGATVTATGNLNVTGQYQVGGSQISSANLSNDANLAKLNGTGPQTFTGNNKFTGTLLQQNTSNSTTAFQIQDAAGTSNLLIADTTNTRIGIGTLPGYTLDVNGDINIASGSFYRINGTAICGPSATCAPQAGSGFYIQNGVSQQTNANFNIVSANAASIGGIIRGATGQSADLFRAQDENGANVFTVGATGSTTVKTSTNSTTGFQIQDSAGTSNAFVVDTTNTRIGIGQTPSTTGGRLDIKSGGSSDPLAIYASDGSELFHVREASNGAGAVYVHDSSGNERIVLDGQNDKILLGAANDVNLYRSAASTLKTDSYFVQQNTANSTTAFQVQNTSGKNVLDVDTSGGIISLGNSGASGVTGNLKFNFTGQTGSISIIPNNPASTAYTLNLPAENGTLCSTGSVCAGYASSSTAFVQNGNSFSAPAVLGTNDSNSLSFETNNATQATIAVGGATTFKNSADSTAAFQIQNSAASSVFTADTSNRIVTNNADFNVGLAANVGGAGRLISDGFESGNFALWTNSGMTIDTATVRNGKYSAKTNVSLSQQYSRASIKSSATAYARGYFNVSSASTGLDLIYLINDPAFGASGYHGVYYDFSTTHLCLWNGTTSTTTCSNQTLPLNQWHLIEIKVTVGNPGTQQIYYDGTQILNVTNQNVGTNNNTSVEIGESTNATGVAYTDDVVVDTLATGPAASLNVNDSLHISGSSTFGGSAYFRNGSDSTTAFQIQNSAGTSNLFNADTINSRIGIGTATPETALQVAPAGARISVGDYGGGQNIFFGEYNNADTDIAQLQGRSGIKLTTGSAAANTVLDISSTGQATFKNSADSTAAFQIQNAAGNELFRADTTGSHLALGKASTLTTDLVLYNAGGSGSITLQGSNPGSSTYAITLPAASGTVCLTSGNCAGVGGTGDILNNGNSFSAPVILGSNDSNSLSFETNNQTQATIAVGGATTFKNSSNSTTAFQIQNSTSGNLFQVDTSNSNITLNGLNSGELQAWQTNSNTLPLNRSAAGTVIANGYLYEIGGGSSGSTTVYYGKINTDGSAGSFSTGSSSLPGTRKYAASVTANGYVYVIGGSTDGTSANGQSTVYYAKLNADGSTGSWTTNIYGLPIALNEAGAVVANGYVYVVGGQNTGGTNQTAIYYAKLNADGSTGSWTTSGNSLPAGRSGPAVISANGYIYSIGGTFAGTNAVYYASLNSDGSTSSFSTNGNNLPANLGFAGSVVLNGYLYVIGGSSSSTPQNTIYYGRLNANGSVNAFSTSATTLPAIRSEIRAVTSNGYIYVVGGDSGSPNNTVYYASTERVKLGGSLDLVGLGGQTLANPGDGSTGSTGGSLTAGNTNIVGSLQVAGSANFSQGVGVLGNFTSIGSAAFQSSANSNIAFQIQNAAGTSYFSADTINSAINLGNNGAPYAMYLPGISGAYGSTPDSATNSITGDIDIRIRVAPTSWASGANQMLVTKWTATGNQRAYQFNISNAGTAKLQFQYSPDGSTIRTATTSSDLPFTNGQAGWVRVTYASGTGAVNYYYASDSPTIPTSWTAVGSPSLTAGSIFDSTAVVEMGTQLVGTGSPLTGTIYRGLIYNGIGGTLANDFDPTQAASTASTTFTAVTGETWTRNGAATFLANSSATFGPSQISLNNATLVRNVSNSTTGFQVQNAAGQNLVQVDTSNNAITLNGNNSGELQAWQTNANSLPAARQTQGTVVANGYLYNIGGSTGGAATTNVYYSKLSTDGSTAAWTTSSNPLPTARAAMGATVANGYVYVVGGFDGSGVTQSTIYYAKLNADGSTGAWSTNANALPSAREGVMTVAANGYIYAIGGTNGASAVVTIYYAKLNADGSTGAWSTNANSLAVGRDRGGVAVANGYVYVVGGATSSTVYYGKLNSDGSIAAFSTNTNALPGNRILLGSVIANGYIYAIGGNDGTSKQTTVYYGRLNLDGSVGAWSTSANALPAVRDRFGIAIANGYVYLVGGSDGSALSTVIYASTARIKLGGSLDLVGLGGQTLADPGDFSQGSSGGSLTAGNGTFIGSLQVAGQGNFGQGVSVLGNFTNNGSALFQNSSNTTVAFQIQNSAGNTLFNADTLSNSTTASTQLVGNGNFETSANGWKNKGSADVPINSTDFALYGAQSLKVVTNTVADNGVQYRVPLKASTQYTLSLWLRRDASSTSTINIGRQDNNSDTDCLTGQTVDTTWRNFTCTFTTGATINDSPNFYIKQTDTVTDNIYIDGVSLVQAASALAFNPGGNQLNLQGSTGNINLNAGNTGELQAWQLNPNPLPASSNDGGTVIANGYIYQIRGSSQSTVYYAKLNTDGSISTFTTSGNSLPANRKFSASVTANGYIYVIGGTTDGTNANAQSLVYYAKLNADGSMGSWQTNANNLPAARLQLSAVVANGYVYAIGGRDTAGTDQNTVFYAKLNADGSTGTWITSGNNLPNTRSGTGVAVANGFVYVIGGQPGSTTSVYYAALNSDGSTGSFSSSTVLPASKAFVGTVVSNGYIYVIGGGSTSTYYYGRLNANGTVGSWTTGANSLPANRSEFQAAVYNGYVYVTGGFDGTSSQQNIFYASTARILVGGSLDLVGLGGQSLANPGDISTGSTGGSLTAGNGIFVGSLQVAGSANFAQSASVVGNFTNSGYALFQNSTNSPTAFQIQNAIGNNLVQVDTSNSNITLNGLNSGELQAWATNANTLPGNRRQATSVVANGYVYVLGGFDGTNAQTTVYYAKLNADGSTGSWATNANALPIKRRAASSVVANGYVYVIGGFDDTNSVSTVYYAKLNADGSTGAWQTNANALTSARRFHSSVVANGYVYVIGGEDASFTAQTTVYYAKLNADGSTGAWSTNANALLAIRAHQSSVVANGYVYVLGGSTANNVYRAQLNADGSTGAWSNSANTLPVTMNNASSVVANGYVYVIGGNSSGTLSTVYYSKLNLDGTNGTWTTNGQPLPAAREALTAVVANGYVYAIAGFNGTTDQSTVYYASTARLKFGGSLDLVGLAGQTLADAGDASQGSTGGSLTAGNGTFVGSLQVQGQASFAQGVSVTGNFTNSGYALFQNSTNAANSFLVENAAGSRVIGVDNTTTNLITNGNIEQAISANWAASGTGVTVSQVGAGTASPYLGSYSLQINTNGAAKDGAKQTLSTLSASTVYNISWYDKLSSGSFTDVIASYSYDGTAGNESNCTSVNDQTVVTGGWRRHTCTFTTGSGGTAPIASNYLIIKQNSGATRTFYIDAISLVANATAGVNNQFRETAIQLDGLITSPINIQPASDSTSALSVTDQGGTNTVLSVSTLPANVGVCIQCKIASFALDVNGQARATTRFVSPSFDSVSGALSIGDTNATAINLGKTGSNIQTTINGTSLFKPVTDSANALQVQNSIGSNAINIDTTSLNSLLTNTSFENASVATWTYSGAAGGSVARDTTQQYYGSASLKIITGTTAAAFDGVKSTLNSTLSASTTYQISWEDIITSGTFTDVIARFSYDGTTGNASSCTSMNTQNVTTAGWTRHTCSFTTGSAGTAPTSSNAIFIVQQGANGGTQRTFYIDAVQVEQASNSTAYKETGVSLNSLVSSPIAFKNATNSTTAFQIQNASGSATPFIVDTINNRVILGVAGLFGVSPGPGNNTVSDLVLARSSTASKYQGITLQTNTGSDFWIYQSTADDSLRFQPQGFAADVFSIDQSAVVTIAGTTTTFASLTLTNAHFKSTQTNAPTMGSNSGCGGSPTITLASSSTDSAGKINITTGTSPGGTCAITINFNKAYGTAPKSVIITNASSGSTTKAWYVSATTTSSFTVSNPNSVTASTVYDLYYWVIE